MNIAPFPYSLLLFLTLSVSARGQVVKRSTTTPAVFCEQAADLAIKVRNGHMIELPRIYDSLASSLPADSAEQSILVNILKKKGFAVTNWGRGNYPPKGPRIISYTLQKGDCSCEVSKIYYYSTDDAFYEISERISCDNKK